VSESGTIFETITTKKSLWLPLFQNSAKILNAFVLNIPTQTEFFPSLADFEQRSRQQIVNLLNNFASTQQNQSIAFY
jgi:hypothetical protein